LGNIQADIIIISYNSCELTLQCIQSIYDTSIGIEPKIIVVDNSSTDNTIKQLTLKFPSVKIIKNHTNLGYAAAANIGIKYAESEFAIVTNSDVIYHPDSIKILIDYLTEQPEVAIVGPQQQYLNGKWEYSYGDIPGLKSVIKELFLISSFERGLRDFFWNKFKIDRYPKEVDYVDGAVLALRIDAFKKLGGFDEDYFFYTEEADYCYRLKRAGWVVIFNPKARVTHIRGGSSSSIKINEESSRMFIDTKILFCRKHFTRFHTKIYIGLCIINTFVKCKLWRALRIINFHNFKNRALKEYNTYNVYNRIWKEEYRKLKK
jgi:GT2 family glycosyltransferase